MVVPTQSGLDIALILAAKAGGHTQVRELLKRGANARAANTKGSTALHYAASHGNEEMVATLLVHLSAQPDGIALQDFQGRTALHYAAYRGHKEIVECIMKNSDERPDDIALQDNQGVTPLHFAIFKGHKEVALLLAERYQLEGIRAVQKTGLTALHLAAQQGFDIVVKTLVRKRASIDVQDNGGRTALHYAAWGSKVGVLDILLDKYATLDQQDNRGWTALHIAADQGHAKAVQILLDEGASVLIQTDQYKTPNQLIARRLHMEMSEGRRAEYGRCSRAISAVIKRITDRWWDRRWITKTCQPNLDDVEALTGLPLHTNRNILWEDPDRATDVTQAQKRNGSRYSR